MRQLTLRERGGRAAIGLPLDELAVMVQSRNKLAAHGKTVRDATAFYLDHLERIQRCNCDGRRTDERRVGSETEGWARAGVPRRFEETSGKILRGIWDPARRREHRGRIGQLAA